MKKVTLRALLATPPGQLALFGTTLLGAAVFAFLLSTQLAFFQAHVQERYERVPPPDVNDVRRAESGQLSATTPERLDRLYAYAMTQEAPDTLVRALVQADPAWFAERLRTTLIAGSVEQRRKALDLAVRGGAQGAVEVMTWALARTRRMGPAEVVPDLERALAMLGSDASR